MRKYNESTINEKFHRIQRNRPGEFIDKVVLEWFNRVRNKNLLVFEPMVQGKPLDVPREIE